MTEDVKKDNIHKRVPVPPSSEASETCPNSPQKKLKTNDTLKNNESNESEREETLSVTESEFESEDESSFVSSSSTSPIEEAKSCLKNDETPKTPIQQPSKPKFVFGSAAKSLTSFNALATKADSKLNFGELVSSSVAEDGGETLEHPTNPAQSQVTLLKEIETGEENEISKFSSRAKLFEFSSESKEWKEKGVGLVKINEDKKTKEGRILMRSEGIFKVLINFRLFNGMKFELLQGKNVRIVTISLIDQKPIQYLLRFNSPEEASLFELELSIYCNSN